MNDDQGSDYGSELDYTDLTLLDRLDALPSSTNEPHQVIQQRVTQPGELPRSSREQIEAIAIELQPQEKEVEENKRSLWERYRKRRGWGALSVSDFASPTWCEYQHTYRLASKPWLPPLERPATITTSKGLSISIDSTKTVKRERVLVGGTKIHAKIERSVMGDVEQIKVETEGSESWWSLRILNTIVSLMILIEKGRVREVPVVGFVGDHLVFGVIDEIDRREITIPPLPVASTSTSVPVPSTPQPMKSKSSPSKSKSTCSSKNASPSKKNGQSTLHAFFSPSPTKPNPSNASDKGKGKAVEPESSFRSDDAFMDLTSDDDAADLAALAEIEELERIRNEPEKQPEKKTRWGYVISDTKTRFNRSLPPESDTLSSRLQLMLYHRLFTSLLQPEPPPSPSPSPSSLLSTHSDKILPSGSFPWSKLYEKLSLSPSLSLPPTFLSAIEPIIVGSELEELLGEAKTLGDFVIALGRVGRMLRAKEGEGEVLERECEISYVLREEEGGKWKGRRSAKKKKGKGKVDEMQRDEEADLEAAIKLSLRDSRGKEDDHKLGQGLKELELSNPLEEEEEIEDSQLPFLANPSLPLPFDLPPPSVSQQSTDGVMEEDGPVSVFSLPTNSQANQEGVAPRPAMTLRSRSNGRYNLRQQKPIASASKSTSTASNPRSMSPLERPQASSNTSPSRLPVTTDSVISTIPPLTNPTSSPPSPTSPVLIGTSRFPLQLPLLSSHLSRTLSYWTGQREPVGVSIDQVKRCRTCEFEDGCEWREGKAREMEEKGRERKRVREEEDERRKGVKRKSVEVETEVEKEY